MKKLFAIFTLMIVASAVFAETDYKALKALDRLKTGKDSFTTSTTIKGVQNGDAKLILDADNGDDAPDKWTIESEASGNDLSIMNDTNEVLNLTSSGNLQVDGDFTANGGDITAQGAEGIDGTLVLMADDGDDTPDSWIIESEATGNDLSVLNGTTEVLNLTSSGNLQVDGTLTSSTGNSSLANLIVQSALVQMANLPTSTSGLSSGALWNNSNVINIVP